ncbi:Exonuclease SbcD [hydrothermal vent metagenome]|uniref:Nuclease SbcCD subunit D n=1 Tax=hydrothermal vent metagenome TaxID=652676 RepID=A0A1W1D2V9_9ZZZZ
MKLLHTSDWHLGQSFKNRSRQKEHQMFLEWLLQTIQKEHIELLIVAGDIFDTTNPPNYALKLYHNFLSKVKEYCQNVIIIAGNHDSITTLEISKELLEAFSIFVITDGKEKTIIPIKKENKLQALVCAVPFLRDKILRDANKAQTTSQIENDIKTGIQNYYQEIYQQAKEISSSVPIIATGHFTTTNASITPDSEREIYIGKLQAVDSDILKHFDYVAMGHIHKPQLIANQQHIRYSGSPIPLSFSEANQQKSVVIADLLQKTYTPYPIPSFKKLYHLKGDLESIQEQLTPLYDTTNPPFIAITTTQQNLSYEEMNQFMNTNNKNGVDIVLFQRDIQLKENLLEEESITLQELTPLDVFEKRIQNEPLDDTTKEQLTHLYKQIMTKCENEPPITENF